MSAILSSIKGNTAEADTIPVSNGNIQTMQLLEPASNIDPAPARAQGNVVIVDDSALLPEEGPSGTMADISKPKSSSISVYVVRSGDTLSTIAELFGVSPNTILWANDLPKGATLKVGQSLTILPVTGVKYTVKKGDTIAAIAKKFGGDSDEILSYNGLTADGLAAGVDIIIPDGEIAAPAVTKPKTTLAISTTIRASAPAGTAIQLGYYSSPLARYVRTQGVHGSNGVDLAAPTGTQILASAEGDVIVAKDSGYNGGYGKYVVIKHDNGSQTLYAHASGITVAVGDHVTKGQVIGYVGISGKATGPHVHFEIRNGIRNPF